MDFPTHLRFLLRVRWLRAALVALLLVAQHDALTHALFHAGRSTYAAADGVAHDDHAARSGTAAEHDHTPVNAAAERCTFDLAYSQVLGGVHTGATVDAPASACHALPIAELRVPRGDAFVVPYDSRGPPASS